jgi:hypothetical protein
LQHADLWWLLDGVAILSAYIAAKKPSTLEGKRTGYEHELIERLHATLRPEIRVILLADRGFG